jgi:hypothetical protein
MWKNWLLKRRNLCSTCCELLLPVAVRAGAAAPRLFFVALASRQHPGLTHTGPHARPPVRLCSSSC